MSIEHIALIVSILAIVVSAYTAYETSRKTTYINVITSERIKWMGNLRKSIADLCGLTYHWAITPNIGSQENQQIIKEIDRLSMLVKLQLSPDDPAHEELVKLVEDIPKYTGSQNHDNLLMTLNKLMSNSRILLKKEWEVVKREAREGQTKENVYPWMK